MSGSRAICGAGERHSELLNTNSTAKNSRAVMSAVTSALKDNPKLLKGRIKIPVVFHILYNTPAQKITDAAVYSQIEALNRDFNSRNTDPIPDVWKGLKGNAGISFFITQRNAQGQERKDIGIERRETSVTAFAAEGGDRNNIKFYNKGGLDVWDRDRFLNIWVVNFAPKENGNILFGFAVFPSLPNTETTDGVVINYKMFGQVQTPNNELDPQLNLGRTAVHEVGHWLNLYHIWGYGDVPECVICDEVYDTPVQKVPNSGGADVNKFPLKKKGGCDNGPNGDMFMNYMDYTDDVVTVMFTKQQVERMRICLGTFRKTVYSSDFNDILEFTATSLDTPQRPLTGTSTTKFLVANWEGKSKIDLVAVKAAPDTNSGKTEIHVVSASSKYQDVIQKTPSDDLTKLDPAACDYHFVRWPGQAKPCLAVIVQNGTESKSTELHLYSGDSHFALLHSFLTGLPETDAKWHFVVTDWNRDGHLDLVAIKTRDTREKKVEIHVFSGASEYKTEIFQQFNTPLDESPAEADHTVQFLVTDFNGSGELDILVIWKGTRCGGETRVDILDGAGKYREMLLSDIQTGYLKTAGIGDFALIDWTGDGRVDLVMIQHSDTAEGKVNLLVMAG